MGPSPLLVVLALSRYALSFQTLKTSLKPVKLIDDSSAKAHFCSGRKHIYAPGVALLFSQKNDQEPRIPFFARTINKLRRKKEVNNDDTTNVSLPSFHDDVETPGAVSETKTVESEAALLRATAEKMRLEARKMDLALTLSKIDKLEKKLSGIRNHPDWRSNILSETQSLIQKLNPSTPATNIGAALAVDKVSNETTVANTSFSNETTAISNEELQQRIEDFLNGSSEERLNLAYSAGFADESNATAIVLKLYEYEQKNKQQKNMIQAIKDGTTPMLSVEKRDDAIQGFEKMPQQIKDMMAKTVGMKDGKNATAVIDKLMEENRLYDDEENDQF